MVLPWDRLETLSLRVAGPTATLYSINLPAWPPLTTSSWRCPFLDSVPVSLQGMGGFKKNTRRDTMLSVDQASIRKERSKKGVFSDLVMNPGLTPKPTKRGSCGEGTGLTPPAPQIFLVWGQGESLAFSTNESLRPGKLPEELGGGGHQKSREVLGHKA